MKTNSQKKQDTRKAGKLKLNKETIRDLTTDDKGAEKVKGGARDDASLGCTKGTGWCCD